MMLFLALTLLFVAASVVNLNYSARRILEREKHIMATQTELAAELTVVKEKIIKIGTETRTLLDKVQELTDAIANAGQTTPEVDLAMTALKEQVDVVDALVPDAPPTPPTT